jgi:peroxin-2
VQTHLHTDYGPEILLALRAVLFKLSIWNHNASYGASLQGLRYTDARNTSLSRPPPQRWQKGVYGLITVAGRYAWTKWETYLMDQESSYEEPSPLMKRMSDLTSTLSSIHSVTALASFLTFLYNGRYRTLLDRSLRLRLVPNSSHTSREVSFEYLNRQLVWHAFTEFLLFLLPLVGIARWRRIVGRAYQRMIVFLKRSFGRGGEDDEDVTPKGELGFLPERTCAICYADQNPAAGAGSEAEMLAATTGGGVVGSVQTDITNPYEAIPCGDVFCFVCLAERIEAQEGEGWVCLRCGELVKECKPWNGDVIEEQPRPSTSGSKSVGFSSHEVQEKSVIVEGEEDEDVLREVEPMPTEDEDEEPEDDAMDGITGASSIMDVDGLGDSVDWARASEVVDSTADTENETETGASDYASDEQSDDYEEEKEELDHFETHRQP